MTSVKRFRKFVLRSKQKHKLIKAGLKIVCLGHKATNLNMIVSPVDLFKGGFGQIKLKIFFYEPHYQSKQIVLKNQLDKPTCRVTTLN